MADFDTINENEPAENGPEMQKKEVDLRFSGVIRDAWMCYREGILKLLLIVAAVTLPVAIIKVFLVDMNYDYEGVYSEFLQAIYSTGENAAGSQDIYNLFIRLMMYSAITALLTSISLITDAAAVILVGRKYKNAAPPEPDSFVEDVPSSGNLSFSALFETAFKSFPKLWLTMFIVRLAAAAGLMLCILPGIFIYYAFIFAPYSVELTGLWGRKATFVSTLFTRRFPKESLLFAIMFFAVAELALPMVFNGIGQLLSSAGLNTVWLGIFDVIGECLEQMGFLFAAMCGAVLFIRMLPEIDPLIKVSGVQQKKNRS